MTKNKNTNNRPMHGQDGWELVDYDRREYTNQFGVELVERRFTYERGEEPNVETQKVRLTSPTKRYMFVKPLPDGMYFEDETNP